MFFYEFLRAITLFNSVHIEIFKIISLKKKKIKKVSYLTILLLFTYFNIINMND